MLGPLFARCAFRHHGGRRRLPARGRLTRRAEPGGTELRGAEWRALALAVLISACSMPLLGAQQGGASEDPKLIEEIEALVGNVFDQRMARQFDMGLELPAPEVRARLEVFERWLGATRRGVFPDSTTLPEGLVEAFEKIDRRLRDAGDAPSAQDLDAVLLFLEQNTAALQKASGLKIVLPM